MLRLLLILIRHENVSIPTVPPPVRNSRARLCPQRVFEILSLSHVCVERVSIFDYANDTSGYKKKIKNNLFSNFQCHRHRQRVSSSSVSRRDSFWKSQNIVFVVVRKNIIGLFSLWFVVAIFVKKRNIFFFFSLLFWC